MEKLTTDRLYELLEAYAETGLNEACNKYHIKPNLFDDGKATAYRSMLQYLEILNKCYD